MSGGYEKQVYTPGSFGRLAGVWKKSVPHRLSTGALCERHDLIAPDGAKTALGRVYVYRFSPHSAPGRVQYCLKSDNYKRKAMIPPNSLAARYKIEQYAINVKIAEMQAAKAAAQAAAASAPQEAAPAQYSRALLYAPFIVIGLLSEFLILILAYVRRGTS